MNLTFAASVQAQSGTKQWLPLAGEDSQQFCLRGTERSDPSVVTRHDLGIWSRDRCLTLTVLRHSRSASTPADGDAFWTLGCLAVAAQFVETATKTSSVRGARGRISIKMETATHRHSTLAVLSGSR